MSSNSVLLRSDYGLVEHLDRGHRRLVVTFNHHGSIDVTAAGFRENVLLAQAVDLVTVKADANYWYQDMTLEAFRDAVGPVAARYDDVVLYGSSMGGYAALFFSGALKANRAIVVSPQVSVDPRIVPWEPRWIRDAAKIRFSHPPVEEVISRTCRFFLFYDPTSPDLQHVRYLREKTAARIDEIRIYFGGHSVMIPMIEAGILGDVVRSVIAGGADAAGLRRLVRAARPRSPRVLINLLTAVHARSGEVPAAVLARVQAANLSSENCVELGSFLARIGRVDEALAYAERATVLDPHHSVRRAHYGLMLAKAGRVDEAVSSLSLAAELSRAAVQRKKSSRLRTALHLKSKAEVLRADGRLEEAAEAIADAVAEDAENPAILSLQAAILAERGDHVGAKAALTRCVALDPEVARYHRDLSLACQRLRQREEAVMSALRAVDLGADNPHFHANLANALRDAGLRTAALCVIDGAIAMDRAVAYFHRTRAGLLEGFGRTAEALDAARTAAALEPANAAYGDYLQSLAERQEAPPA